MHLHSARHFFHGSLLRTAQTALSTVTKFALRGTVHQTIKEIGDNELFAEWKTNVLDSDYMADQIFFL